MRKGLIYKITCLGNNNFIIGSTINFKKRKSEYYRKLKNNIWANQYLQNCYNKYGKDSIVFEIIEENILEDVLINIEDSYIEKYCSSVDNRKGGMNMRKASNFSPCIETRRKMSLATKKYLETHDHPFLNKTHSEETKDKIRKSVSEYHKKYGHPKGMLGKKQSKESIEKMLKTKKLNKARPKPSSKK